MDPFERSAGYSRAFETFVADDDDIVGLVAYALYKQTIGESAKLGQPLRAAEHRTPP